MLNTHEVSQFFSLNPLRAEFPPLSTPPRIGHSFNSSLDCQGSCIPPHQWLELSTPRASLDPNGKVATKEVIPSMSLHGEFIEDAWNECQKGEIYAI